MAADTDALKRVVTRVTKLAKDYEPPTFDHVPNPDAALFLSAIDHQTGYTEPHMVDGDGPYEGSDLLWALAEPSSGTTSPRGFLRGMPAVPKL